MDTAIVEALKVVVVLAPVIVPRLLLGRAQQQARLDLLLPHAGHGRRPVS